MDSYLNRHTVLLGGPGVIVEVDETVLCRRRVIRCPSNEDDSIADTVWIVGGVDSTPERNFFLQIVPNRQIVNMTAAMRSKIRPGSILRKDGHASYPGVADILALEHQTVNHSE